MNALLQAEDLTKTFTVASGMFTRQPVAAVAHVDLTLNHGEVLGLVGESGSGKTTLARCLLGLTPIDSGQITFDGTDITHAKGKARTEFRRRVQPVFQDPFGSIDPRWSVGRTVREALDAYRIGKPSDRDRRVSELLERVGLRPEFAQRRPRQLSGGQRQRVGIAAALATGPDVIVADEPVSALDVSVQAQVLNLFADLQADLGVAVLFVAHDLSVVKHISQRVAVLYLGRVVETADVHDLFTGARHPYTRALLQASPQPDPSRPLEHTPLGGEIPSPLDPPSGCAFHTRCALVTPRCVTDRPTLVATTPTHETACWITTPPPDEAPPPDLDTTTFHL